MELYRKTASLPQLQVADDELWPGAETLDFARLAALFSEQKGAALEGAQLQVKAVAAGEVVARCCGELPAPGGASQAEGMRPGERVELCAAEGVYRARGFGYLCLVDNCVEVISPIVLSVDHLSAYYADLPQWGLPVLPSLQEVIELLREKGVEHGIRKDWLARLCASLPAAQDRGVLLPLAEGRPPEAGKDAALAFAIDMDARALRICEDGELEVQAWPLPNFVSAGTLLARREGATRGRAGKTVLGAKIEAVDGIEFDFEAGEGVRAEETEEGWRFFSTAQGHAQCADRRLWVRPALKVQGDVDTPGSAIDFEGDVYIAGAVRTQGTVKAGGNVVVVQTVDSGATLRAGGDLEVGNGIMGESTTVVALGDLRTRYVQEARVRVCGDVWIGSYVQNAALRCGGALVVHTGGGSRGGRVIGGIVSAVRGMRLAQAGSASSADTVLELQTSPLARAGLDKVAERLAFCEGNIAKMMRTLGLRSLASGAVRALLAQAPAARRELYVKILKKLNELIRQRDEAMRERQRLEEEAMGARLASSIEVSRAVFAGVNICIDELSTRVQSDLGSTVFCVRGQAISAEPGKEEG